MLKKPCKIIKDKYTDNEIKIYGNGHYIEIEYQIPDWNEDSEEMEACFKYKGQYHFLSEFMRADNNGNLCEFDGYRGDSYFSGLLVKFAHSNDCVQVYTYIT